MCNRDRVLDENDSSAIFFSNVLLVVGPSKHNCSVVDDQTVFTDHTQTDEKRCRLD